ncbi:MAG: MBL fold metallo-hydrolase [Acidimicrobiales bacterium]
MVDISRIHPDITALSTFHPIPAVGVLTINSFVLHGEQEMIVDTGTTTDSAEMCETIGSVVDGGKLRWLWITHTDADHIGSVHTLLDTYPNLTVVTTYTGWVKMSTHAPVPPNRVRLVNPGDSLDLGDRVLHAYVPPLFDAPETTGFIDPVSNAMFSSDCFGAILPESVHTLDDLSPAELLNAQTKWTAIDTPWVTKIDRSLLNDELEAIRELDLAMILSAHLPATPNVVEQQLAGVCAAPDAEPFTGIDHATLQSWIGRPPPD